MLLYIKDYLVNMLFIILPIVFYQALITKHHVNVKTNSQKIILAILFSCTSILCLSFPVQFDKSILDLRLIPFIIGTLYGGIGVGGIVLITSLIFRFYLGGIGFYVSIAEYLLVGVMLLFIYNKYKSFPFFKKIITAASICVLPTIIGMPIAIFLFDLAAAKVTLFLVVVSLISIVSTIYLLENTIEKTYMLIELHKREKESIVSHLAASVSHEVRNPLTVTKGFIQLLRDKYQQTEDKLYFDLALEELKNAELIISDFLTYAKPAIEKVETVDMYEELQHSINVITPYAKMNNIHIELKGGPVSFIGDIKKIHQVYINIFKNCIEAMSKGGNLSVSLSSDNKNVKICIKDTGIGMSKEQLLRLGEPYFSSKENGTGLGMMV
ncbi:MAG TPA: HAMP domain-containing sensor histidine kinase, partial [Pseudoneobacillus sp.]|nr:HAMP domain-containing sensor histidine kinase [Pseudoneobacillus sp.]